MGYLRDQISLIVRNNFSKLYNILYDLRESWRIKRQNIFKYKYKKERYPGLFLQNDYEPFPYIESKIDRVIYCFWTGDNEMSENRKRGYQSLIDNSGIEVILITPKNLKEYILPNHPLHPAYDYLSLNHKSDYLRCYFAHFYGGGYCDIKSIELSWVDSFNLIENSDKWILSYTQLNRLSLSKGQGIIDKDLRYYYKQCVGTGAYINKSNTKLTAEWYKELIRRMDEKYFCLKEHPGDAKGRNKGYPFSLLEVSSQIMCPLYLKYNDKIIHDNRVLPILTNYQ